VLIRFVNHLGYTISFDGNAAKFVKIPEYYSYQTPNPALLVDSLIDSFKNNDKKKFKSSLLPDVQTFKSINKGQQNKSGKENIDELYGQFRTNAINSWLNIIKKASLADINWADVNYRSQNRILVGINGVHILKTTIHIEKDNKKYTILLDGCILFNKKWYVLSGMKWL